MTTKNVSNQKGFTIIEMMIATSAFAIILLVGSMMIIQIGRMYYRGVVASNTQEIARTIIDEISRPIQIEGKDIAINPTTYPQGASSDKIDTRVFCVGERRYTYATGVIVDKSLDPGAVIIGSNSKSALHALWVDGRTDDTCLPVDLTVVTPSSDGVSVLAEGSLLSDMQLQQPDSTRQSYVLRVFVMNADDDLLETRSDGKLHCRGVIAGSQWCGESDLQTTIFKRINK